MSDQLDEMAGASAEPVLLVRPAVGRSRVSACAREQQRGRPGGGGGGGSSSSGPPRLDPPCLHPLLLILLLVLPQSSVGEQADTFHRLIARYSRRTTSLVQLLVRLIEPAHPPVRPSRINISASLPSSEPSPPASYLPRRPLPVPSRAPRDQPSWVTARPRRRKRSRGQSLRSRARSITRPSTQTTPRPSRGRSLPAEAAPSRLRKAAMARARASRAARRRAKAGPRASIARRSR